MRRRVLHLAAGVIAVLVALGARAGDVLQPLELNTVDARFAIRGDHPPRPGIAIVALDGRTLSALDLRPPLPRRLHARVMDRLRRDGARLIGYDVQFIGPTDRRDDQALLAAIRRAHPVLATHDVDGPPLVIPAGVMVPEATIGSIGLLADPDGNVRREPYSGQQHRSFETEVAERLLGRPLDPARFPAWIDYAGAPRTYPTYSLVDVLQGRVPATAFRGKLVIVGSTDPIEKDVFPTPVSSAQMPGAEIHANGIASILAGFPLRSAPDALDTLLIVLLGMAPALFGLRIGALKVLALSAGLLIAYLVGAQLAFDGGRIVLVTYPLLALVLSTAGTETVEFLTTTRERQRLRRNFGGDARARRHGGVLHGRRDHGGVRRADRAARPRRPRTRRRARDAHGAAAALQRVAHGRGAVPDGDRAELRAGVVGQRRLGGAARVRRGGRHYERGGAARGEEQGDAARSALLGRDARAAGRRAARPGGGRRGGATRPRGADPRVVARASGRRWRGAYAAALEGCPSRSRRARGCHRSRSRRPHRRRLGEPCRPTRCLGRRPSRLGGSAARSA